MCGISVIYSTNPIKANDEKEFREIMARTHHRGYSLDEIARVSPNCMMGANRLEIVDREAGRQPFISNDKNTAVVLNGEIYNFLELRDELSLLGSCFKTTCDTNAGVLMSFAGGSAVCMRFLFMTGRGMNWQ